MDLIGFILIFSSVATFASSAALCALGHVYGFPVSGLAFIFLGIILFLAGIALIWLAFRMCLRRLGPAHFALSKRISARWGTSQSVVYVKEAQGWTCEYSGNQICFDLRGLAFKKSFLLAFSIRAIRYPIISGKLPIAFLSKSSLTGFPKKAQISAVFQNGSKGKLIALANDGLSKCGLVPKLIIESRLPHSYSRHSRIARNPGRSIIHIDEESFVGGLLC